MFFAVYPPHKNNNNNQYIFSNIYLNHVGQLQRNCLIRELNNFYDDKSMICLLI